MDGIGEMLERSFKIAVHFESRDDGGLRVWSEDVPELVLSHADVDGVLDDVKTALEIILSHRLQVTVRAQPLVGIREALEANGMIAPRGIVPCVREYVAYAH